MATLNFVHKPVLLDETLQLLAPAPGEVFVDCTLGGGGHARALWDKMQGRGTLIAIDQDGAAIAHGKAVLPSQIILVHDNFRNLHSILVALGLSKVDGILFDLGVSSPQLDQGSRGFSYRFEAPLDMRMNTDGDITAADLLNSLPEAELAKIIWEYGEERWAKRIAKFIVKERDEQGFISTTGVLVDIIRRAIPKAARQDGGHPARRTFQALRIAVNKELDFLQQALAAAIDLLAPGGRVAVITFHSLEDRIVKQSFKEAEQGCICPPRLPICVCGKQPSLRLLTKKPIVAPPEEVQTNPRARSAKLRVAERIGF